MLKKPISESLKLILFQRSEHTLPF